MSFDRCRNFLHGARVGGSLLVLRLWPLGFGNSGHAFTGFLRVADFFAAVSSGLAAVPAGRPRFFTAGVAPLTGVSGFAPFVLGIEPPATTESSPASGSSISGSSGSRWPSTEV